MPKKKLRLQIDRDKWLKLKESSSGVVLPIPIKAPAGQDWHITMFFKNAAFRAHRTVESKHSPDYFNISVPDFEHWVNSEEFRREFLDLLVGGIELITSQDFQSKGVAFLSPVPEVAPPTDIVSLNYCKENLRVELPSTAWSKPMGWFGFALDREGKVMGAVCRLQDEQRLSSVRFLDKGALFAMFELMFKNVEGGEKFLSHFSSLLELP